MKSQAWWAGIQSVLTSTRIAREESMKSVWTSENWRSMVARGEAVIKALDSIASGEDEK